MRGPSTRDQSRQGRRTQPRRMQGARRRTRTLETRGGDDRGPGRSGRSGRFGPAWPPAAQHRPDHDRRPGLWRPRLPRQSPHPDAQPRSVRPRERPHDQTFCVSPVCSPTRSSLLTGRYNYRTGVVDTFMGRSLMRPDETTLAEVLAPAGYRTGIFGKWHLGDNAPLRPIDQGFQKRPGHQGRRDRPGVRPARRRTATSTPSSRTTATPANARAIAATSTPAPRSTSSRRPTTGRSSPTWRSTARTSRSRHRRPSSRAITTSTSRHPPSRSRADRSPNDLRPSARGHRARLRDGDQHRHQRRPSPRRARQRVGIADNTIVIFLTDNGPAKVPVQRRTAGRQGDDLRRRHPRAVLSSDGRAISGREASWTGSPRTSTSSRPCWKPAGSHCREGSRSTARACCRCCAAMPTSPGPIGRSTSSGIAATSPSSAARSPPAPSATSCSDASRRLERTTVPPLELYDMEADPGEEHNIAAEHPRDRRADARRLPRLVPGRLLDARLRSRPDRDRRSAARIRPC